MLDLHELKACLVVYDVQPSPRPDIEEDMVTIGWRWDGKITVGAGTDSPVRLADRLRALVAVLVEHPSIVEEMCGVRGASHHLLGTLHRIPDIPEDDG